jgi:hypothetical protein
VGTGFEQIGDARAGNASEQIDLEAVPEPLIMEKAAKGTVFVAIASL